MFPDVLPLVRSAIQFRYSLIPHLYHLLRRASTEHEPLLRPPFLDHEHDARAWEPTDDFLLGEHLLVASVVEPGQRERRVYLPDNRGKGWWDWHDGNAWYSGGQTVTLAAPLARCPSWRAAGASSSSPNPLRRRPHPARACAPCAPSRSPPSHATGSCRSRGSKTTGSPRTELLPRTAQAGFFAVRHVTCELHCSADKLRMRARIALHAEGSTWRPSFREIAVVLPLSEQRQLIIEQDDVDGAGGVASLLAPRRVRQFSILST